MAYEGNLEEILITNIWLLGIGFKALSINPAQTHWLLSHFCRIVTRCVLMLLKSVILRNEF